MPRKGILFILVGPSGAGKNTLMKRVQQQFDNLPQLATMTTRSKREGEKNGREHWFISHAKFQELIDTNALIEWQRVHMNDLYGTPRRMVEDAINTGHDLIADIEFLGAAAIHEGYPDNTVLVFVTPSRLDILTDRILQRGNITPEVLANRLERARFEMTFAPRCHYLIVNDMLEPAADHLRQIVASERLRRDNAASQDGDQAAVLPRHVFHCTVTALVSCAGKLLVRAKSPPDNTLPSFPIGDHARLPHDVLRDKMQGTFGSAIHIETIADSRFEFTAPHHVTIAATPPDVCLTFFYKCTFESAEPVDIAGWVWRPVSTLDLLPEIGRLVTS